MSAPKRFCSDDSVRAGDPLAGTASHPTANLLLSWPRRKWQRNLRQAADMPAAVAAQLDGFSDRGRRVNLIHRREQPEQYHRAILMPEREAYDVPREELPAFLQALARSGSRARWRRAESQTDVILCCTHGRKDKCCARFGYRTYQRTREAVADGNLPFDVWESTHLGGCRMAAGLLVLPRLRKYGRVSDEHIPGLLRSEAQGKPYLPCYRGDSRLQPVQQCAEVAALHWLRQRGLPAEARVIGGERETSAETTVLIDYGKGHGAGRLRVQCRAIEIERPDTCADYERAAPGEARTVWLAENVEPLHGT